MKSQAIDPIETQILDLPVSGLNLRAGKFGDQLQDPSTLLAFLRHLG